MLSAQVHPGRLNTSEGSRTPVGTRQERERIIGAITGVGLELSSYPTTSPSPSSPPVLSTHPLLPSQVSSHHNPSKVLCKELWAHQTRSSYSVFGDVSCSSPFLSSVLWGIIAGRMVPASISLWGKQWAHEFVICPFLGTFDPFKFQVALMHKMTFWTVAKRVWGYLPLNSEQNSG